MKSFIQVGSVSGFFRAVSELLGSDPDSSLEADPVTGNRNPEYVLAERRRPDTAPALRL